MVSGAAERSGQLSPGDEVLEVNGLKLKGKSVHDICDTLCRMTGTLTFVIIPKSQHVNLARFVLTSPQLKHAHKLTLSTKPTKCSIVGI